MNFIDLSKNLKRKLLISKNIYLVGHNDIDLDALGSIVGLALIAKKFKKIAKVIIDDKRLEMGVSKVIEKVKKDIKVITSEEIKDFDKSLLIVTDCNKNELISFSNILSKFTNIIVIDHHDLSAESIKTPYLYVDTTYSSACEIVTELIKKYKVKLTKEYATYLFSGIVLDTNNFILKADKRTFYYAYYLLENNASTKEVQYLLKQDLKKFINRERMLTNVRILDKKIAIAKGIKKEKYRREDLAKIADTLLLFNHIETSFVIGSFNDNEIGISGRTLGNLNIGKIMQQLGGGGSKTDGATKLQEKDIREVEKKLINIIKK